MLLPYNPPRHDWRGCRVWIIGASSGIGRALAQSLLAQGARVALSARHAERLDEVAAGSAMALVLPLDAADLAAWSDAYATVHQHWGGLDLILFCAAEYRPQRSWELQAAEVKRMLEVNLASVYYGVETVLPAMLAEGRGGIAVIASVAGYLGLPGATVYGPTKAALINLAELLYCDLHGKGLAVYLINPGFVKTPLTAKNAFAMPALQTPEQAAAAILHGIERGRFEIHFPRRFTLWMKLAQLLPYRLRLRQLGRALGG
ncbi:SDR family NAD(P)-dependent oxidoreductase [Crenobacter sp. SG2305]|uniref:SDR family NAD(P)-dependent oxidoreductase n=1 Tax=Crenobacter oryzisoli TaxID=3056844 RepID=UPI0025AB23E0|nr:SDR family NAD(P)-dependent oxidoreductase [Crenobacter sp. SG2305]MDN0082833.1 SDR family NAD(P)-dependent oxidoreductase [Crenobacter sp. SG2305]